MTVLGIPRGGTVVGYEVAKCLDAEFSIIVVHKLPFPDQPEAGFGAIAEDGSVFINPGAAATLPSSVIDTTIEQQRTEVARRVITLRGGTDLPELRHRNVILVDDGIAMGSTARAAIMCCRNAKANRITVAAPVASPDAVTNLESVADGVVALLSPPFFRAVAEAYRRWYDVPDAEVQGIMREATGGSVPV